MTEFTDQLQQKLKEQGLSEVAIQRVLSIKERMRLPEDDPFFEMLFELEWYLKQMESIPKQITQAQLACQHTLESETDKLVQSSVYKFSNQINKTLNQTMRLRAKADYWSGFSLSCVCMMVLVSLSLTVGYSLHGNWPSYFDPNATSYPVISFIYSAMQLPTFISAMVISSIIPIRLLAKRIMPWKKRD